MWVWYQVRESIATKHFIFMITVVDVMVSGMHKQSI